MTRAKVMQAENPIPPVDHYRPTMVEENFQCLSATISIRQ
jgi:hypothetical protein